MEKAGGEGGEYKKGRMPGSRSPFRRAWARGNERLWVLRLHEGPLMTSRTLLLGSTRSISLSR
jgi:hypothetical protein